MKKRYLLLAILGLTTTFSCKKENDAEEPEVGIENEAEKQEVLENYAELVYANYSDAYTDAVALQTAITAFVDAPSASLLTDAKDAWIQSRESYGPTEAFRFAGGPIDDFDGPEGLLNAWPLDEGFIDYVDGNATAGIINDNDITISYSILEGMNEDPEPDDISIGYHAIEFLLWGQDLDLPSALTTGNRLYTDYTTADNATRRGTYLKVCSQGIIDLLQDLKDEWKPSGAYRTSLLKSNVDDALTTILGSIAELAESELGGERVAAAYNSGGQEEEHSCFSDNTHRDIILNAQGVENVFTGTYNGVTSVSGASIADLLKDKDLATYTTVIAKLEAAVTSTEAIPAPFDYAIYEGNTTGKAKVYASFLALQELGDALVDAGDKIGFKISFDVDTVIE